MRDKAAILVGKSITKASRTLKIGGGSAAPGLYALKIDPNLVEKLIKQIPKNIIITGTNGKTTTARILSHLARETGLKVIRNHTGSNLERGIASALINGVNLSHPRVGLSRHLGVWELDEFAFNALAPKIKADIIVFLNVSRDQLDRYGEVDKVVSRWCETLSKLDPKTIVLINKNEPDLQKIKQYFKGTVQEFGDIKNIKTNGLEGSQFELLINHKSYIINLALPGIYHIYDAVAAIFAAYYLNLPIHRLTNTLSHFQPAFGRFEKLTFGYIFLIKNPAGATLVFETIAPQIKSQDRLLFVLNDNLADGTDVSWIWDVELENFRAKSRAKSREYTIYVSGTRAYDLAVRLKYAGFNPKSISVIPKLENALQEARRGLKGKLFILPTYTALLNLQKILTKQGLKHHYWEDS